MPESIGEAQHRALAAVSNNAAWTLLEMTSLGPAEAAELVRLAATALTHWQAVGNASNIAHAQLLYSWALARAGAGMAAQQVAKAMLAHFGEETEPWERAFAQAAMAATCLACGDGDGHGQYHSGALGLAETLDDGARTAFEAAFATIPTPE